MLAASSRLQLIYTRMCAEDARPRSIAFLRAASTLRTSMRNLIEKMDLHDDDGRNSIATRMATGCITSPRQFMHVWWSNWKYRIMRRELRLTPLRSHGLSIPGRSLVAHEFDVDYRLLARLGFDSVPDPIG